MLLQQISSRSQVLSPKATRQIKGGQSDQNEFFLIEDIHEL
ncbi:MAG: hypothetical protein AAFW73_26095 [Bacteroidota bacterium]